MSKETAVIGTPDLATLRDYVELRFIFRIARARQFLLAFVWWCLIVGFAAGGAALILRGVL